MRTNIRGRIWKFDHNVDTDVMAPWKSISSSWDERRNDVFHIRPEFVDEVRPGDIIVAGCNWGCGSSREQAAENIKRLGLSAVVAESFGRIFFRNAIALALPAVSCTGVHEAFEEGDILELELGDNTVRNLTKGNKLSGHPYTRDMLAIMEKGGLMNLLKEKLKNQKESK